MRPARAPADGTVEVAMTVNGNPVTLDVPPRLTLADALRENLGLTGTHLGCEHGVCGMCTVLVDGAAARACLLFACQLDGSEVLTVEGLGRQDDLHPLQEAFGKHHALQCGFCTPGFLMSSYDLLSRRPEVTEEELPEELSGVLCRCTGYRNIVSAVGEVAGSHRDGLPGPRNCGRQKLIGTGSATGGAGAESEVPAASGDQEIRIPSGEPTLTVQVGRELSAPIEDVWRVVSDIDTLAVCLPGAELTEHIDERRARGRAKVSVGPVRLSFAGVAHIVESDADAHTLRALAQGEDVGGARTQADIRLRVERTERGCRLEADAAVHLTGRIAQFGRALAGDVSRRLFEQFCDSVEQAATGGGVPTPRRAPGALQLLAGTVVTRVRAAVRRFLGRRRSR